MNFTLPFIILKKNPTHAILCSMVDLRDSNERFKNFHAGRASFFLVAVIACFLFLAVLKFASTVIVPFVIALFLALVLHPLLAIPARFKLHRTISIFIATALVVGCLFFAGYVVFRSGRSLLSLYPKYETRLTDIFLSLSGVFDLTYDEHLSFFENLLAQLGVRTRIMMMTLSLSNTFFIFLRDALMVVLFMVFLLFESAFFRTKLETGFEGKMAGQIKKIGFDMMSQISRYLSIKFIISVANGIIVGVLLRFVGLEFALIWGILQFILNFIPSLGSIAIGVIVSLFALVQFWPDPYPILMVVAIMIGINMLIGFVLEPKIMGDNLGISPIVVLMSLVAWGFLWGFAGMVLAVPLTVIIKIICENVPMLEPISILLGSRKAVLRKKAEYDAAKEEKPPT